MDSVTDSDVRAVESGKEDGVGVNPNSVKLNDSSCSVEALFVSLKVILLLPVVFVCSMPSALCKYTKTIHQHNAAMLLGYIALSVVTRK